MVSSQWFQRSLRYFKIGKKVFKIHYYMTLYSINNRGGTPIKIIFVEVHLRNINTKIDAAEKWKQEQHWV